MATTSTSTRSIARAALPSHILFEEQDGIYWLRGTDLERSKKLLGLRVDGNVAGFDRLTWCIYVGDLAKQRIPVGLRQGNIVRTVHLQRPTIFRPVRSTPTNLAPAQLFGLAELERLERGFARKDSTLRETLDRIGDELANGHSGALADFGDLFVYQVGEDIYEVDWDLTGMAPSTVELLALAVHRAGHRLFCQLVPPMPRRGYARINPQPTLKVAEPVAYGQLRLPI